jgi:hypothetical protein
VAGRGTGSAGVAHLSLTFAFTAAAAAAGGGGSCVGVRTRSCFGRGFQALLDLRFEKVERNLACDIAQALACFVEVA